VESGLHIVVDGEYVVTSGLGSLEQPEIQMRFSSNDEIAEIKTILLRIASYVVSCGSRLRHGDVLNLDGRDVQVQGDYSGRLEIKRLSASPGEVRIDSAH
jgi:hypothetical protein